MIRKAKESDIVDILEVLSYYNFKVIHAIDKSVIDEDATDIITVYNQISEINLKNAFVALYNSKIVGFSHYKPLKKGVAKTTLITVLPEYRGLGLGKDFHKMLVILCILFHMLLSSLDSNKTGLLHYEDKYL